MPPIPRLLARVVDVRDEETRPMLLAGVYFFFILAAYFVLRPIRDTLGVAAGVSKLPYLFVGTLSATLICQPLFAALVARFPARRFIPIAYQFFALNLVGFWFALRAGGAGALGSDVLIGRVFFVWTSVFNLFVVSVFWCFMADLFTSEQAKRLFGFIGVGGTLGGMVGAGVTVTLVDRIGPVNLLLVSLVLLEIATVIVLRIPRPAPRDPIAAAEPGAPPAVDPTLDQRGIGGGLWTGITHFVKSPYLLGIGTFLVLYTMGSTILYFQQANIIGSHFPNPTDRTKILAEMEFAGQMITVLTQLLFTGRIIKSIGLGATLALMPALSVIGFVLIGLSGLGVVPALMVFVGFSVLRRGSNFALTNPAMEVLYTVVSREDKYKAKSFIETFVYRAGDQIAAWSYAALAAIGLSSTAIAWPGAVMAGVFLAVGLWLGKKHRELAALHR